MAHLMQNEVDMGHRHAQDTRTPRVKNVGYSSAPLLPFLSSLLHLILLDRVQHELVRVSRSIA
jgi:hypothetical protein